MINSDVIASRQQQTLGLVLLGLSNFPWSDNAGIIPVCTAHATGNEHLYAVVGAEFFVGCIGF